MLEMFVPIGRLIGRGLGFLPGFCLRVYFTEKRLQSAVNIDVTPRGEQLIFDLGSPPRTEVRLRVINFTALPVTVDRLKVELWGLGNSLELHYKDRVTVPPSSFRDIYVRDLTGVDLTDQLKGRTNRDLNLNITAYLKCKVREFVKHEDRLGMLHVDYHGISSEQRALLAGN